MHSALLALLRIYIVNQALAATCGASILVRRVPFLMLRQRYLKKGEVQCQGALDVQMRGVAGSGNGLTDYLFYFFFSPSRDCLEGGSEAYTNAKIQAEMPCPTVSPDLRIATHCEPAHAGGLLFERVEHACGVSIHQ